MSEQNDTIDLAQALISKRSITPEDNGCQQLLAERLEKLGFSATQLRFDDVDNLWITHGEGSPCLIYIGHTDVVPPGPPDEWSSDPFIPEVRDGMLYGRGAADMKGSIASMTTALERFVHEHPDHNGTIGMLITSDEEGIAINGTRKVVDYLEENKIKIDWGLVGEPSSVDKVGDVIKNGRRGSLGAILTVYGQQGHVAYPHLSDNPVHRIFPVLDALATRTWDKGNEFYPPTTFQVTNIHAGTGADNVVPGTIEIMFNFRFNTETTADTLQEEVIALLEQHKLNYKIDWNLSGHPFFTADGVLLETVKSIVREVTGIDPVVNTDGGTSDGRFIAPTGTQVVELGPSNQTIHKVNECVSIHDLHILSSIYERVLKTLMI